MLRLFDDADHRDGRRRINGAVGILVVETDVAARNGRVEDAAGFGESADRFFELPENFRVIAIAEVQIVGRAERQSAGAGQVPRRFSDRDLAAFVRIEINVGGVAIHRQRDELFGAGLRLCRTMTLSCEGSSGLSPRRGKAVRLDAKHRRVAAGADDRTVAHHMVVLAINPLFGRDAWPCEQGLQVGNRVLCVGHIGQCKSAHGRQVSRLTRFAVIHRRFIRQLRRRNVGHDLAVVFHDHAARVGDRSNFRPGQIPLVENPLDLLFAAFVDDEEHAFLRFAEEDFVRRHVRHALRNFGKVDLDAGAGARRRFAGGTGQTGRAHVLNAGHRPRREQFKTGFQHQLLHERVAHLHGPALLLGRRFGQILRGKRRAGQAVPARRGTHIEHRVADAAGFAARDLLVAQRAQTKRIHQRIAVVAAVEMDLAGDGRDAEAIAIMRDAGHDTGEETAIVCDLRFAICGRRVGAFGEGWLALTPALSPGEREILHRR